VFGSICGCRGDLYQLVDVRTGDHFAKASLPRGVVVFYPIDDPLESGAPP
jgi:hypothetical protein